ncbi:MAG: hypothetical protein FD143_1282 [Ignavibacteria bacterium]|nr:MAG: hypothetical protein FD143_1282 [Ignavibacteria bacterium]KAF0160799.1 MAG: hypothetical protein FD188_1404 [Ignavibacteria bacterium]
MLTVYDLLKGNDFRSIGRANEVIELVTSDPELFDEVFNGIFHEDKIVRARCADALEKAARKFPVFIQKKKSIILKNLKSFHQKEVVWHIASMLGLLVLTAKEKKKVIFQIHKWLNEQSSIIVKVMCIQTLADFALRDKILIKRVREEIEKQMINGAPAVKARGRHLLEAFDKVK